MRTKKEENGSCLCDLFCYFCQLLSDDKNVDSGRAEKSPGESGDFIVFVSEKGDC